MSPADLAIETHALSKTFGRQTAVDELALVAEIGRASCRERVSLRV